MTIMIDYGEIQDNKPICNGCDDLHGKRPSARGMSKRDFKSTWHLFITFTLDH